MSSAFNPFFDATGANRKEQWLEDWPVVHVIGGYINWSQCNLYLNRPVRASFIHYSNALQTIRKRLCTTTAIIITQQFWISRATSRPDDIFRPWLTAQCLQPLSRASPFHRLLFVSCGCRSEPAVLVPACVYTEGESEGSIKPTKPHTGWIRNLDALPKRLSL